MRRFEPATERIEGQPRRVVRVTCSKCGTSDIFQSSKDAMLPPEIIAKKFSQRGWVIGNYGSHDICPACVHKKEKPVLKVVETPKAEPPRAATREDRRIIMEKLREVYLEERGYAAGWSDNRVASDMGVPRAWVADVRELLFGASGASEEMEAFVRDADLLLRGASQARDDARNLRKEVDEYLDEVRRKAKGLDDVLARLAEVETLAGKIRKMGAV